MTARVASPNSGRTAALSVDGAPVATIAVPNTGSFATFRTVSVPVTLPAGTHTLKLAFSGDGQNLDWIAFADRVTTPTPDADAGSGRGDFVAVPTTAPHGSRGEVHGDPGERQEHQRRPGGRSTPRPT